jgi:DNA polymerase-3 subunit delta'
MARAAATPPAEVLRVDTIDGWPAPEERTDWLGDPAAETVLLDAYRSGRMHHAWLIGGPKGIGKATLAYRFARFVLAHPDPAAANIANTGSLAVPADDPVARRVAARAHPNLLVMDRPYDHDRKRFRTELTVPEVRRTISFFGSTGGEAGWRIAVVDPADELNPNAANALLKGLEEPPRRSLFLLVSHAPGRVLPTIRSRCRRLHLAPLGSATVVAALRDRLDASEADLALAAALAEGSLRRAILLLEGDGLAIYRALTAVLAGLPNMDVVAAHDFADSVARRGDDDAWTGFADLLGGWLDRRVRRQEEPAGGARLPPAAAAAPLERWAEVWEKLAQSSAFTDEYNLDRKRTVLSILMSLARATRM